MDLQTPIFPMIHVGTQLPFFTVASVMPSNIQYNMTNGKCELRINNFCPAEHRFGRSPVVLCCHVVYPRVGFLPSPVMIGLWHWVAHIHSNGNPSVSMILQQGMLWIY